MPLYWGVDLGGTKIEGVVLSIETGAAFSPDAVLIRKRIDTEAHLGYEHILSQIVRLIDSLKAETGLTPERIGFATPGTNNPATQTMKNSNTTVLNGKPMRQDLTGRLGVPVELANDANCFALAETHLGIIPEVLPKAEVVVGLILGTGVGSGIVVNGKVLQGRQGIAGEWGHNYLDKSGGPCLRPDGLCRNDFVRAVLTAILHFS